MKLQIDRDTILKILNTANRFVSDKLNVSNALQGVYLLPKEGNLHVYATNLTVYYHSSFPVEGVELGNGIVIEPRKVIEFVQLLQPGNIQFELQENQCLITQQKTKGTFPVIQAEDFPTPPVLEDPLNKLNKTFLTENLPFILFTASSDDSRPVLTGINFVVSEDELAIVSTDGFRLSLLKETRKGSFSSMIIPADFLLEVIKNVKEAKEVGFVYSQKEQIILFKLDSEEFYSRLIDGEFPPYERVIPTEKKTTIELSREELLRNTKLISIFARDYSNVILYSFTKDGLLIKPKEEIGKENATHQDITFEGEDQQIAFNFKYVLDFLNHIKSETIIIEILRPDAPVVFKAKDNQQFVHIIMPVRIQS